MAGLEVVVRPVVFPNIRPVPTRSLQPVDDPTQGFATIGGNGAKQIQLTHSWSVSTSKSRPVETKRQVDEVRIYQKDDQGTVNRDNFVDVRVANKIWTVDPAPVSSITSYARQLPADNIDILNKDIIQKNPDAKG